jgi:alpha-D-ribose 1-methylphosphonate 5-phosphate C-P lyase
MTAGYNFAYLIELKNRMILRAILLAVAVPVFLFFF